MPTTYKPSMPFLLGSGLIFLAALSGGWWLWKNQALPAPSTLADTPPPQRPAVAAPDFTEPAEDYSTFLHVLQTGGCGITRPAALAWLDRYTRENAAQPLPEAHSSSIMKMIAEGGHRSWEMGYRQHLFNSAFNALHHCHLGEPFTRLLLHLSLHDADRTMRLYAMQHLNMQRRVGHLANGPLADEVYAAINKLAQAQGEEVSGYAIEILVCWDGGEDSEPEPALQQLALATAADTSRPVDIRVTAIHAAGSASLPLARALATRSEEHVMLRKAAIARIGEHGTTEDFASLESLRAESSRLAQAAEPALARLRKSQLNTPAPTLAPY